MDCTDGLDDWVDWVIAPDKFAPVKQKNGQAVLSNLTG